MREVAFVVPLEYPWTRQDMENLRNYLRSLREQLTDKGKKEWAVDGKTVGVGFLWYTARRNLNGRLPLVRKKVVSALVQTGIIDRDGARECVYNLEQRIKRAYGSTPQATIKLVEGDEK